MSDAVKTEPDEKVELPAPTVEGYIFPDLPPQLARFVYYDDQRHRVWVGIDLDKTLDPIHAAEVLSGARSDVMVTKVLALQDQGRKQQLAKPGGFVDKLNQTLKETFRA